MMVRVSRAAASLRDEFARIGYTRVDQLLRDLVAPETLAREVGSILDRCGRRRDIRVEVTSGTQRTYVNVGRDDLASFAPIEELYFSAELQRTIEGVVGRAIAPVPYVPEQFVANRIERTGDTNGWHWDDYAYALVWVLAAPPPGSGADLELVAGTEWNKTDSQVEALVRKGLVRRRHLLGGQAYVLRSDTTLHRVTPLTAAGRRDVLCFAYAQKDQLGREITHETVELLYDAS